MQTPQTLPKCATPVVGRTLAPSNALILKLLNTLCHVYHGIEVIGEGKVANQLNLLGWARCNHKGPDK